ncbi:MAG: rhomboid family intramembrane serine protease [Aureisphaera sp.]
MAGGNLAYQFKMAGMAVKVIVINAIVFIGFGLVALFSGVDKIVLEYPFVLPHDFSDFLSQPWSILTYSFFHSGIWHILVNMYMLFWFGRFVLNLFSPKRFLTIYLLGGIAGGVFFLLSYNLFPLSALALPVVGASGAVMAIMVFMATYAPSTEVRIFMFNLRLWHIVAFFVVLDLLRLGTAEYANTGGLLVHLGGAIFGYVYARQLLNGKDIGVWFERLMDSVANLFKTRKQKPFKKVHRNKATQSQSKRSKPTESKDDHQKQVDAILDKISKSGYESLTKAEKDFLFKAGKDN